MSERPRVVYWTNQPSPYVVGRLNAVHDRGSVELCAWFDEVRQIDRSWNVDPSDWRFDYRWVPEVGCRRVRAHMPLRLLRSARPDVVVQLFDRPSTGFGALASRFYARRVTFRVLPAFSAWGEGTILTRLAKKFLFRLADAVKVPGHDGGAYANQWGMPSDRCFRVEQTIDVTHYRGDAATQRAGLAIRSRLALKDMTFIYVGRLWNGKGLDYLLEAFRRLRALRADVSLLIAGDGLDELHYRRLGEGIEDVSFVGFVQSNELPAYYAAASVLVFPTLGDPHGLVIEEAMAAGLAIITTDAAGDIRARVTLRNAGRVVQSGDADALFDAMLEFATEPGRVHEMGRLNSLAVAALSHDAYAQDFDDFIEAVLALPRRPTWASRLGSMVGRILTLPMALAFESKEPFEFVRVVDGSRSHTRQRSQ